MISNGVRQTDGVPAAAPGQAVFSWKLSEPVASYLTTIYIDTFTLVEDTLADGKPIVSAIAPSVPQDADLAKNTKQIIDVLSEFYGPYPFEAAGGIYTGENTGFALETATRPIYPGNVDIGFLVHELAHQWWGDDVTVQRWSDICLNECFASYGEWLYNEKVNGEDLDATWKQRMNNVVNRPAFWSSPLVDMGPGNEFTRVYDRGPLALHALRDRDRRRSLPETAQGVARDLRRQERHVRRTRGLRQHPRGQGHDPVHGRLVPRHHGACDRVPLPRQSRQLTPGRRTG